MHQVAYPSPGYNHPLGDRKKGRFGAAACMVLPIWAQYPMPTAPKDGGRFGKKGEEAGPGGILLYAH